MKKMKLDIQMFAMTMSDTVNYSGMLYSKVDENTRFLDAVYSRGKNGGRTTVNSIEFALSSGYELASPSQPAISEEDSLLAPIPVTVARTQEYNVTQIFQKTVQVSYVKQSNNNMLSGLNTAGAVNNVPNELDFQIGKQVAQVKLDLNYTLLRGTYQYTKGNTSLASKTRGLIQAISTNAVDANGAPLTKEIVNGLLIDMISNGANVSALEIWVNPADIDVITNVYSLLNGSTLPASRTTGGIAYSEIVTPFGIIPINWEANIPAKTMLFVNVGELAVAEKPYFDENGTNKGVLFYESLAKTGASEKGQIYGELGFDYGAEWMHGKITNFVEDEEVSA